MLVVTSLSNIQQMVKYVVKIFLKPWENHLDMLQRIYMLQDDWTPVHVASQNGHTEVLRMLYEAGADIQAQTMVRTFGLC